MTLLNSQRSRYVYVNALGKDWKFRPELIIFISAKEVITQDRMSDFEHAIRSRRTRELIRSRTAATKSAEIKQLRKAADLLDTSSFQESCGPFETSVSSGASLNVETSVDTDPGNLTPPRAASTPAHAQHPSTLSNGEDAREATDHPEAHVATLTPAYQSHSSSEGQKGFSGFDETAGNETGIQKSPVFTEMQSVPTDHLQLWMGNFDG